MCSIWKSKQNCFTTTPININIKGYYEGWVRKFTLVESLHLWMLSNKQAGEIAKKALKLHNHKIIRVAYRRGEVKSKAKWDKCKEYSHDSLHLA